MKIALCGYKGKTGSKVYETLIEHNFDVIGIDKQDKLIEVINIVDLVIDFTNKEVAKRHIDICIDNKINFIVASTGFNYYELANIKARCNQNNIKGIICYNFSFPINIILKTMPILSKYYEDISYLDIHHISKIDKFSGTSYLILLKNKKIKIKSIKTNKKTISYVVQMVGKYDKMIITYQVTDKKAFALGILYYLLSKDESYLINLIG